MNSIQVIILSMLAVPIYIAVLNVLLQLGAYLQRKK